jgi:hypothetical protein
VSSVFVSAAPVGICVVVAKVPDVGKVTVVVLVKVNVLENAPDKICVPAVVNEPPRLNAKAPQVGAAVLPDRSGRLAVAVPDNIAAVVAVL